MRIEVSAAAEEAVRGFVAEESKCCPCFSFQIDEIPDRTRMTVETPPGGERMLAALEAAFKPGASSVPATFDPPGPSFPS